MPAMAVGAKALGVAKSTAPHCADCALISSLAGKGISFGLGIGLGGLLPYVIIAGSLYFGSQAMLKHMKNKIVMITDQS